MNKVVKVGVLSSVKKEVVNGEVIVHKTPTIYDVAALIKMSIATVSRVMNGSPKVSPRTRAKVLAAIEYLSYTPNINAVETAKLRVE